MVDEQLKSKNDFRITLQKIVLQSYAEVVNSESESRALTHHYLLPCFIRQAELETIAIF